MSTRDFTNSLPGFALAWLAPGGAAALWVGSEALLGLTLPGRRKGAAG